jgi:hypothetical protein
MKVLRLEQLLKICVVFFAVLYFFIDAIFLSIIKRAFVRLGKLPVSMRVAKWVSSIGPYQSVALFLIPLLILEPVKPVSIYLIATGHAKYGIAVLIVGEILKIALVERVFHATREKLLLIPAFAWIYNFVVMGLDYIHHLPGWQFMLKRYKAIKATAHEILGTLQSLRKRNKFANGGASR